MNIKLIVSSILGIGSLGSVIAGGYYYFKSESSEKKEDISDSDSKTSKDLGTAKLAEPESQTRSNSVPSVLESSKLPSAPAPKEVVPDSRPSTSVEPEVNRGKNTGSRVGDASLSTNSLTEDSQRAVET